MKLNSNFTDILFAALFAAAVSTLVYFGFANIYSSGILNYTQFSEQFQSGIYQHRVLSGWMLTGIYDFLGTLNLNYDIFRLQFLEKASEPRFYIALYLLNTLFTVLTAICAVLITKSKLFQGTDSEKILTVSTAVFTIALSQFVIVPYDASSYFFLLFFLLFFIRYINNRNSQQLVFLIIIIALSTFNRESSALSLSLAAAVLYSKYGLKRQTLAPLLILSAVFIASYCAIRLFGNNFATNDGNLLIQNFTDPKNWLGLTCWIIFFWFSTRISNTVQNTKIIYLFHLFSLPYLIMCLYSGILYEVRLYVPLFLTSIFLAKLKWNSESHPADSTLKNFYL